MTNKYKITFLLIDTQGASHENSIIISGNSRFDARVNTENYIKSKHEIPKNFKQFKILTVKEVDYTA